MNDNILKYKNYLQYDCDGPYIILKINDEQALKSMKAGHYWFRHPAFFNYAEDKGGNSELGDKIDNKLESIINASTYVSENFIQIHGALQGKNMNCFEKVLYKEIFKSRWE